MKIIPIATFSCGEKPRTSHSSNRYCSLGRAHMGILINNIRLPCCTMIYIYVIYTYYTSYFHHLISYAFFAEFFLCFCLFRLRNYSDSESSRMDWENFFPNMLSNMHIVCGCGVLCVAMMATDGEQTNYSNINNNSGMHVKLEVYHITSEWRRREIRSGYDCSLLICSKSMEYRSVQGFLDGQPVIQYSFHNLNVN